MSRRFGRRSGTADRPRIEVDVSGAEQLAYAVRQDAGGEDAATGAQAAALVAETGMAKSIALVADAPRLASLLLIYIQAVCAFVAPRQPGASTAIIERLPFAGLYSGGSR